MPYFYHLEFELYPTPTPYSQDRNAKADATSQQVWVPPAHGADIFADDLPSHPRPDEHTSAAGGSGGGGRKYSKSKVAKPAAVATQDWRFGRLSVETVDPRGPNMPAEYFEKGESASSAAGPSAAPSLGPTLGSGHSNRAEYVALQSKNTELGWGVVHFYREGEESTLGRASAAASEAKDGDGDDCTTLCIPAVPGYMTPGDFLGFVGERWRDDIVHCRMVMTSRMNKYLALLKFREGDKAKKWKREFDGKAFSTMGSQTCHVVFVRRITFSSGQADAAAAQAEASSSSSAATSAAVSNTLKPFPPPTPDLIELPTCPVCLERMDETNGLMTIPCSHVFHCSCLQNWTGAGCPVCRFTNARARYGGQGQGHGYDDEGAEYGDEGGGEYDPANPYSQAFGAAVSNLCSVCDSADDLWICLICGRVGCGRYKGGHAKDHWKETAHSFALELETQHVWDYAGDMWVHRLIRDKGDGKVVELPRRGGRRQHSQHQHGDYDYEEEGEPDMDMVPRAKLDSIGFEYTHLITSQLESQRAYYEEMISKVVDKASAATAAAEAAAARADEATARADRLEGELRELKDHTVPQLEREVAREAGRAAKAQELARNLGKSAQEEKGINEGLMARIGHLQGQLGELEGLRGQVASLEETNRDLSMFISGQETLRKMEAEGALEEGEAEGGTASVGRRRRRGKK